MKVVHVVPLLFGPEGICGGAERYAYEMALAMSSRTDTTLIAFGRENSEFQDGALQVHIIRATAYPRQAHLETKTNPFSILPLVRELRGADTIVCHQQKVLVSTTAALWSLVRRARVYAVPLGGAGWDLSSYVSTDRLFDGILHISEFSRRIQHHERLARAHVIYAGVSPRRFYPDPGVSRDGTVLFVGRIIANKGIDVLIRALTPEMKCVIAGTPKDRLYMKELDRFAKGKQVTFVGRISDEELLHLYQKAACVVLPSVRTDIFGREAPWTELFGQTVIEAMACATPAIASDLAAFPEIIESERTGFLFPEGDWLALRGTLERVLADKQLAGEVGRRGLDHVRSEFLWDRVVDRCFAIFERA